MQQKLQIKLPYATVYVATVTNGITNMALMTLMMIFLQVVSFSKTQCKSKAEAQSKSSK